MHLVVVYHLVKIKINYMDRIYISHWSGGIKQRNYDVEKIFILMLESFIKTIKKNNRVQIKFITDTITYQKLNNYILDNLDCEIKMDEFYNYLPYQWPLVKLITISKIEDDEVLHLDYDFFYNNKIDELYKIIKSKSIDVLYQNFEGLSFNNYYTKYIKKNTEIKSLLKGVKDKFAYNAGITYLSPRAKNEFKRIVSSLNIGSNFGNYTALEQLEVPLQLKLSGLNVDVLSNLVNELPQISDKLDYKQVENMPLNDWIALNGCGAFIDRIGVYHLLGDCKNKIWTESFLLTMI